MRMTLETISGVTSRKSQTPSQRAGARARKYATGKPSTAHAAVVSRPIWMVVHITPT